MIVDARKGTRRIPKLYAHVAAHHTKNAAEKSPAEHAAAASASPPNLAAPSISAPIQLIYEPLFFLPTLKISGNLLTTLRLHLQYLLHLHQLLLFRHPSHTPHSLFSSLESDNVSPTPFTLPVVAISYTDFMTIHSLLPWMPAKHEKSASADWLRAQLQFRLLLHRLRTHTPVARDISHFHPYCEH